MDRGEVWVQDGNTFEFTAVIDLGVGSNHWSGAPHIGPENARSTIDVDPVINRAFVSNPASNTLGIINGDGDYLLKTISLGPYGFGPVYARPFPGEVLRVNAVTHKVYVHNITYQQLVIVDGVEMKVITKIDGVEGQPFIDEINNIIYADPFIIDGNTDKILSQPPIPMPGTRIVHNDKENNRLYIANTGELVVIDAGNGRVIERSPMAVNENIIINASIGVNTKTRRIYISEEKPGYFHVYERK